MKGQDIVLLIAIIDYEHNVSSDYQKWKISTFSSKLGLSLSVIHRSISYLQSAALLDEESGRVNKKRFFDFAVNSIGILFPIELRSPTSGIATTLSAGIFDSKYAVQSGGKDYVWPSPLGNDSGVALSPIHKSAPSLALDSSYAYKILAALDSIRLERVREKTIASDYLRSLY